MQPHSFKFPKRAQRTFVKYLFAFAFFIFSSVIFTLAGYAHTCGPSVLEMKVGETTTWQITADLTEEETLYTPLNTGDPNVATISSDTPFTAHHGVFTITTVVAGQTSFAIQWYFMSRPMQAMFGEVVVAVKEAEPTPVAMVTPTLILSGLIINDDFFVCPFNSTSTHGKKFVQARGGIFIDATCTICPPPDTASMIASGGLKNDTPDPITLHNGEFVLQITDLKIPGRGFDWTFTRTYKSRVTFDSPLGHNWDFNYNSRLLEITEENQDAISTDTFSPILSDSFIKVGSVVVMDGHGHSDLYGLQSDVADSTPLGAYTRLTKNGDGSFTLRDRQGSKKSYDRNGFLVRLEDRHGNTMTFTRDEDGKLLGAIDTLGRKITYSYNTNGRLVEVKDFINRSITFEYDSNGDLVSVTSPSVTGTPNGNNFPDGKTKRYTYSSGFDNEKLNHGLLTITAPNEVAAGGSPRLINVYETDENSYAYGHVVKQTYGGINASGIAAGGDITYKYEEMTSNPLDTNDPVNRVTVTDRNGNKAVYEHNKLGNAVSTKEYTKGLREGEPEYFEATF